MDVIIRYQNKVLTLHLTFQPLYDLARFSPASLPLPTRQDNL